MLSNDKKKAEARDTIMKSICLNHKYGKIGIFENNTKSISPVDRSLYFLWNRKQFFSANAKRCIKGVIKHTSSSKMLFTAWEMIHVFS